MSMMQRMNTKKIEVEEELQKQTYSPRIFDNTGPEMRTQFLNSVASLPQVGQNKQFLLDDNVDKIGGEIRSQDKSCVDQFKKQYKDEIETNNQIDDKQELVNKKVKNVGFSADGVTIATDTCDVEGNLHRNYSIGNLREEEASPKPPKQRDSLDDLIKVKSHNEDAISNSVLTRVHSEPFITEKMQKMRDKGLVDPDCFGANLVDRGNQLPNSYQVWPRISTLTFDRSKLNHPRTTNKIESK